jgi:hypothetical protein
LYKIKGIRAFKDEFTHMAHIENTGIVSYCVVFVVDSGIGDGHVIASEFGHPGAECNMFCCEGSWFHMSIYVLAKVRHWKWKIESRKTIENTLMSVEAQRLRREVTAGHLWKKLAGIE